MELNIRLQRAIRKLKRDSVEKDKRINKLEKLVNKLVAAYLRRRRRPAPVEGRPILFSSTTIFSSTNTGSSASSSLPESTPSMTSTSTSSSDPSPSTGPQPSTSSSDDSTPSAPIENPETPGSEVEVPVQNNTWDTLDRINPEDDSDLEIILTELLTEAMERVKQWNPSKPEIQEKKAQIVKWILKRDNIHQFTTLKATFSTSRITSIWRGLVNDLFPQCTNPAALITYFGNASRSTHFFGEFVQTVVNSHRLSCRQCALQ